MKLFATGKVGFFLDSITHKTEKRKDGEVKVVALGCRIVPFDHKLAQSMDDVVRGTLFHRTGNAEPHNHVLGLDFGLPIERQDIDIFASPDTAEATRRIEQVNVSKLRAQLEKGSNAFVLKCTLTFGPASAKELEFVEAWRQNQKFLTFHESEPNLAYEEIGGDEEDDDEDSQPALEMEEDDEEETVGAAAGKPERAQRAPIRHATKTKGKKR